MADPLPAPLTRLVEVSEQRRTRLLAYSRTLANAMRTAKREDSEAQRAMSEAAEAYSAEGYRVLNRSRLVVHDQAQMRALLELLNEVDPPYLLYRVTVHGSVPDEDNVDSVVLQMRQSLEARGFVLVEGEHILPSEHGGERAGMMTGEEERQSRVE